MFLTPRRVAYAVFFCDREHEAFLVSDRRWRRSPCLAMGGYTAASYGFRLVSVLDVARVPTE